jgi:flagellar biosynthesis chaperone FliJ
MIRERIIQRLEELSNKTLSSYADKATNDAIDIKQTLNHMSNRHPARKTLEKMHSKRTKGLRRAEDKIERNMDRKFRTSSNIIALDRKHKG